MTPGLDWMAAPHDKARTSIFRALRIDPKDDGATYATIPFRIMHDAGGQPCIGGAIGVWRSFDPRGWVPEHISDVILWSPVSGALSVAGSIEPDLILPYNPEPRLTVYADGFAFFRAWADARAATWAAFRSAREHHKVAFAEPRDSGIPGALAIGKLDRVNWLETCASVLVAGRGVDPKQLNRAIIRSAQLPRVESLAA